MKKYLLLAFVCGACGGAFAQNKPAVEAAVPCTDDADADRLPGHYYDHTQPKYPISLGSYPAADKAAMTKQLIALEKLEEASRKDFQLAGCVARSHFSTLSKGFFGNYFHASYGYQLSLYQNVCHVREHVVKTVGEYRSVLRVDVNPSMSDRSFYSRSGDFYLSDKSVRYDIPADATYDKLNSGWLATHAGSQITLFVSQDQLGGNKENFDKINTGTGYTEDGRTSNDPKSYQLLTRVWYVTRPDKPLFLPITRKAYLEALLEFYEIEKVNFAQVMAWKIRDDSRSNSPEARKRLAIFEVDKEAYRKIYEDKKEKVSRLLSSQPAEWLQKQAVVAPVRDLRPNDFNKPANGLLDFERFYDGEAKNTPLYQFNPEYFSLNAQQPVKPVFMRVQLRYEPTRGFSERFFENFLKNYDFGGLREMLK